MKRRSFFTTILACAAVPFLKVDTSEAKPTKYLRYYWNGKEVKSEWYWGTGQGRFELDFEHDDLYVRMYHLCGHKPRVGDQIHTKQRDIFRVISVNFDVYKLLPIVPEYVGRKLEAVSIKKFAWTDTYVVYTSKYSEGEKS